MRTYAYNLTGMGRGQSQSRGTKQPIMILGHRYMQLVAQNNQGSEYKSETKR